MSVHRRKQLFPQDNKKTSTLPGWLQTKAHLKYFCHKRGDSLEEQKSPNLGCGDTDSVT